MRNRGVAGLDPEEVAAIGMHADAAAFAKNGKASVYGVSWNWLARGVALARYAFTAITKALLCACGCGGFHTLQVFWAVLACILKLVSFQY